MITPSRCFRLARRGCTVESVPARIVEIVKQANVTLALDDQLWLAELDCRTREQVLGGSYVERPTLEILRDEFSGVVEEWCYAMIDHRGRLHARLVAQHEVADALIGPIWDFYRAEIEQGTFREVNMIADLDGGTMRRWRLERPAPPYLHFGDP
jgi:hypothetical protein